MRHLACVLLGRLAVPASPSQSTPAIELWGLQSAEHTCVRQGEVKVPYLCLDFTEQLPLLISCGVN